MDDKTARLRNLKMKLYHKFKSQMDDITTMNFTEAQIKSELFFKKSDITSFKSVLFELSDEKYTIKQDIVVEINELNNKRESYLDESSQLKDQLKQGYIDLTKFFIDFSSMEKMPDKIKEIAKVAEKLHFIYLPIIDEKMIINRGILPEENPLEYYNHFHTIEDLYELIFKEKSIKWDSVGGDINLNQDMKMSIYSNRWGHDDSYTVQRLEDGWNFKHLTYNENSSKNGTWDDSGEEGIFKILNHDSIQYSFGSISSAFEQLWEIADTESMSVTILEERLQDIGDWISGVEKESMRLMPSWFEY